MYQIQFIFNKYLALRRLPRHVHMVPPQQGSVVWAFGVVIKRIRVKNCGTLPLVADHRPLHTPSLPQAPPPPYAAVACPYLHTLAHAPVPAEAQHQHNVP